MIKFKQLPKQPWRERPTGDKVYIISVAFLGLLSGVLTVLFWYVVVPCFCGAALIASAYNSNNKSRKKR